MNTTDPELLRQFVRDGSEGAFTEILRRHVDLVHSAALRQVGLDAPAAEEITQAVFTDLARKASRLVGHPSLTGWLYTSTRMAAAEHRRSEARRTAREKAAHAMSQLLSNDGTEPDWNRLRPVLDEAMHDLDEADREAVLLRFFEKRPFAEIGERLGLSENTARMRVERALDRLHGALSKRGITSTATAIGLALGAHAVAAAPAELAGRIAPVALAASRAGNVAGSGFGPNLAVALAVLLLGIGGLMWGSRQFVGDPDYKTPASLSDTRFAGAPAGIGASGNSQADAKVIGAAATAGPADSADTLPSGPALVLTFLAQDSGQPVPNVQVNYRGDEGQHFTSQSFTASRAGVARVRVVPGTTRLQLISVSEGFADTKLVWNPDRGDVIPSNRIVRLERAALIGGTVVDPDGKPVAGAKVGWNHSDNVSVGRETESHEFDWIEVPTDSEGRWRIHRIAESMLKWIYGSASHPDFQATDGVGHGGELLTSDHRELETQLLAEKHVFRLKPAAVVQGLVVDETDSPVARASVLVGSRGFSGSRLGGTAEDGRFEIRGAPLGSTLVTAEAKGFAAKTVRADLKAVNEPLRLVLAKGTPLRIRVVNVAGEPLPKAWVWLNTIPPPTLLGAEPPLLLQASFEGRTDSEGRTVWEGAPAGAHGFDIEAPGYMRSNGVQIPADDMEHVVTLTAALVLQGQVTDAATGRPIPRFRLGLGWPNFNPVTGTTNAQFSSIGRFWPEFSGGAYRHTVGEQVLSGANDRRLMVKFEAEGYVPVTSRPVGYEEGVVTLDVALEKATELEVTVVDPSGRPVAGADVGLVFPGASLSLGAGGLASNPSQGGGPLRKADVAGRLKLSKDPTVQSLVASGAAGFAETTFAALEQDPVLRLQPWGRITGRFLGKAGRVAGKVIALGTLQPYSQALTYDFSTRTDPDGRFEFSRVPPGLLWVEHRVVEILGPGQTSSYASQAKEVTVDAGESAEVTLGGGIRVSGRLGIPAGFSAPAGSSWRVGLHSHAAVPPPEVQGNPAELQRWAGLPEVQRLTRLQRHLPAEVQPDGSFTIEGVEPGDYSFMAYLSAPPKPDGSFVPPLLVSRTPTTATVGADTGELDLGEIPMLPTPETAP
jgi:RNA polymerase sigma factor (sigma-70 family)